MLLCSCAVGSEAPPASELAGEPPVIQRPAPVEQTPEPTIHTNCILDSYRSGNCIVTVTLCDNDIKDIEVKCDRGRKLYSWEYMPDPPPPYYRK
jgi:hypothetical protein